MGQGFIKPRKSNQWETVETQCGVEMQLVET